MRCDQYFTSHFLRQKKDRLYYKSILIVFQLSNEQIRNKLAC